MLAGYLFSPRILWLLLLLAIVSVGAWKVTEYNQHNAQPPHDTSKSVTAKPFIFPPLSDGERELLKDIPPSVATPKSLLAPTAAVAKVAILSDAVVIGVDCRVYPVALKTQKGKVLEFKNYDIVPHTIMFGPISSFLIPAGETTTISADFGAVGGAYRYRCEKGHATVGVVWINK